MGRGADCFRRRMILTSHLNSSLPVWVGRFHIWCSKNSQPVYRVLFCNFQEGAPIFYHAGHSKEHDIILETSNTAFDITELVHMGSVALVGTQYYFAHQHKHLHWGHRRCLLGRVSLSCKQLSYFNLRCCVYSSSSVKWNKFQTCQYREPTYKLWFALFHSYSMQNKTWSSLVEVAFMYLRAERRELGRRFRWGLRSEDTSNTQWQKYNCPRFVFVLCFCPRLTLMKTQC